MITNLSKVKRTPKRSIKKSIKRRSSKKSTKRRLTKNSTKLRSTKKSTKLRSTKKSTKKRLTKKSIKRRLTKKSTKKRLTKKSTKKRLTKKSTKKRLTKKSTKKRLTKKSTKKRLTKKSTKKRSTESQIDSENLREYFKSFIKDFDKVDAYLGHMPGKLDFVDYNEYEYDKKLESLLERDNWIGSYSIPEYYDMIDKIKFLIKSDKNMKKEILNEIKTVLTRDVILNNLKKKVPELFR